MNRFIPSALVAASIAVLAACSSDDGDAAATGTAPKIANLSFKTSTIPVGKVEVVQGSVDFDDADGDFDAIEGELVFGAQKQAIARYAATTNGQSKGTLVLAFQLGASQAGTGEIQLWGVDKKGNKSNTEKATFEAK